MSRTLPDLDADGPVEIGSWIVRDVLGKIIEAVSGTSKVVFVTVRKRRRLAIVDPQVAAILVPASDVYARFTPVTEQVIGSGQVLLVTLRGKVRAVIMDANRFDQQGRLKALPSSGEETDLLATLRASAEGPQPRHVTVSGRDKVILDASEYEELAALKRTLLTHKPAPGNW